jgi:hypothetical protein
MKKILTWKERCEVHPDHQNKIIMSTMIEQRMQEEIDELREFYDTIQRIISDRKPYREHELFEFLGV